ETTKPSEGGLWCGEEDSNFHGLPHSDLNAARLPIPPPPHRQHRRPAAFSKSSRGLQGAWPTSAPPSCGTAGGVLPSRMSDALHRSVDGDRPATRFLPADADAPPVEWLIADGIVDYEHGLAEMETRATAIAEGRAAERVWLVEHPSLYTAGTSARAEDL